MEIKIEWTEYKRTPLAQEVSSIYGFQNKIKKLHEILFSVFNFNLKIKIWK